MAINTLKKIYILKFIKTEVHPISCIYYILVFNLYKEKLLQKNQLLTADFL